MCLWLVYRKCYSHKVLTLYKVTNYNLETNLLNNMINIFYIAQKIRFKYIFSITLKFAFL